MSDEVQIADLQESRKSFYMVILRAWQMIFEKPQLQTAMCSDNLRQKILIRSTIWSIWLQCHEGFLSRKTFNNPRGQELIWFEKWCFTNKYVNYGWEMNAPPRLFIEFERIPVVDCLAWSRKSKRKEKDSVLYDVSHNCLIKVVETESLESVWNA